MISRQELIDAINDLAAEFGRKPKAKEMDSDGKYHSGTYRDRFDNWANALQAAGFEPYRDYNRDTYQCANCDETVQKSPSDIPNSQNNVYCSQDCMVAGRNLNGKNNGNYQGGMVELECEWCGETVSRKPAETKDREQTFCDQECYGQWRSEEVVGKDHGRWRDNQVKVECDNCGVKFETPEWQNKRYERSFCNQDCRHEWLSDYLSGDGSPRWKGGTMDYYGPNWMRQRRARLEIDDHTCQDCGMTEAEHRDEYDADLHVHHRRPLREFYDDADDEPDWQTANAIENLVTLCVGCHRQWEQLPVQPQTAAAD